MRIAHEPPCPASGFDRADHGCFGRPRSAGGRLEELGAQVEILVDNAGLAGCAAAKSHVLLLSEAVGAEVKEHGVSVTAVCPGPVPTEFQDTNDAQFVERLPKMACVSAERVVSDALAAADRGKRTLIPGPLQARASFAPNRFAPSWLALPITKQIMARK